MQFQPGETREKNGVLYQRQADGTWIPQGAASQPQLVPLAPPAPPSGYQTTPGGLKPIPGGPADKPEPREKPQFIPQGATQMMMPDGTIVPVPGGGKEDGDAKRAATIDAITGEVKRLYEQDIKGQPASRLFGATEYIDSLPANDRFRDAGNTILPLIRPLIAQTAREGDSDKEMEVFLSYVPSNDDTDLSIEQKFKMLDLLVGGMVDGRPPSQTLAEANNQPQRSDHVLAVTQGDNGEGGGPMVRATEYKTVDDPALTGLKGEYLRRLASGQSAKEIITWAKSAGVPLDSGFVRSVGQQVTFRRQNPNVDITHYDVSAFDDRAVPTTGFQQNMTRAAQSAPGAFAVRAGNAVTGNNLDSIVGMTGGNAEQARIAIDDAGRQNPGAGLAGDLVGGVTAALGGEAALARLGMTPGALRAILADMGYGTVAGAGAADDGNRLQGAGVGAVAGLVGNRVGNAVTKGVGNVMTGVTDPSVQKAVQQGIPTTVGDVVGRSGRVGRMVKGVEDRMAGLPIIGDQINTIREAGIRKMNSKAFDKALEPIGGSVGDKVGEEAVEEAHGLVTQAFANALRGKQAVPDEEFIRAARGPTERIARNKRVGPEIVAAVEDATEGLFDAQTGALSGENMQAFLDALRQLRQGYKNDPLYHNLIKPSIQGIEKAVEGMFRRQAPEVMPQFDAAKAAYRRLSTISDAVNRGKNTEGVFTPGQLGMADRTNAKKFDGNIAAASGSGPFHEFQRPMQDVLPNKVPDSGTAGRVAVPAGIIAAGTGIGAATGDAQGGAQKGIGLATLLSILYSKRGQAALTAGFAKRPPSLVAKGRAVKGKARDVARVSATGAVLGTSGDQ